MFMVTAANVVFANVGVPPVVGSVLLFLLLQTSLLLLAILLAGEPIVTLVSTFKY
jgi:hypothetical protein